MDLEVKLLEKNRRKSLESRDKQRVLMFDTKSMIHKRKSRFRQSLKLVLYERLFLEKIFANHISIKALIATIYKELSNLTSKKTMNSIRKWETAVKRYFTGEDRPMRGK